MFSYISSFFTSWFSQDEPDSDDDDEAFESKIAQLEIEEAIKNNVFINEDEYEYLFRETDNTNKCFKRTGIISYIDEDNKYVLIDGVHYYDTTSCSHYLKHQDKVMYLGYYKEEKQIHVVKILHNEGNFWGDEDAANEETAFEQTEHTLIGQVASREGRVVYMSQGDIRFNLDNVDGPMLPMEGDMLEMRCKVVAIEEDEIEQKAIGVSALEVIEVIEFRPLGLKIVPGKVTEWNGTNGLCDRKIYFDKQCLQSGVVPYVGAKVMMKIIESYRDNCLHRAIQLQVTSETPKNVVTEVADEEESTLQLESDQKLEITQHLSFDVEMYQKSQISLDVTNKSDQVHIINKWIILSKVRDSQINVNPNLLQPYRLFPGQTITFTITCQPKFFGKAKEHMVLLFRGFKVARVVKINVFNNVLETNNTSADYTRKSTSEKYSRMKEVRSNERNFVQGRKITRTPNFVAVRMGHFNIPDKTWNLVLGESQQFDGPVDDCVIFERLEDNYPFLNQDLTAYNYADRWHILMYLEEINETINMRAYDIARTYLIKCHDYLSLKVKGLSERRPSLVVSDRVIVKELRYERASKYEGIIHEIKGECILIKFSQAFHDSYLGGDVSVDFYFNRTTYRRAHHAINSALAKLGPEILFPRILTKRPPQITQKTLNSIKWYNETLNDGQKAAVSNILLGECRPKPYCIYGPPGTGKTITLVETILQILTNIPNSRVLVAAPSNSAANIITERLIDYKDKHPASRVSLVRIIAYHYLKADNIPPKLKHYCITVDIAREGTSRPNQQVQDGVNLNCQSSFLGTHRVTIGTCSGLGVLLYMGFPKGHFTHVIVDEAGQTTEPEIMIPLTLTDKDNGQIILAGDPMQLGPVIVSQFAQEFGMDESYLSRLLKTVPYQKDFVAFQSGFNEKLVTKLNDNYRSLKEVLTLPSQMFYDGSLVEKVNRNQPWIERLVDVTSEIFQTGDLKAGGIFVHGIRGCNKRDEDSPSWYNPQEAYNVALTTSKLYNRNVTPDDIGIITPYIAQIKFIRKFFDGLGLAQPKIGTVEEFQGQERPLILISTVRSTEMLLSEDLKHKLGFVKNPKKLNVALTRAQVAVMLFCDPHLLCTDPLWSQVVNQAIKEDKYMGCDLPKNCMP